MFETVLRFNPVGKCVGINILIGIMSNNYVFEAVSEKKNCFIIYKTVPSQCEKSIN